MMKKIQLAILSAAIAVVVFATSVSAVTIQDLKNGKAQAQSEVAALQQQLETVVTEITKLIADIINFFETGDISFDVNETKEVIKLVEMVIAARNNPGVVVER